MATRRIVLSLLYISLSRCCDRSGWQAGLSHAKAKFTAPGHCQRNYSRQVLVLESCYRPVISGLHLSPAELQLAVFPSVVPLRPEPAVAEGSHPSHHLSSIHLHREFCLHLHFTLCTPLAPPLLSQRR